MPEERRSLGDTFPLLRDNAECFFLSFVSIRIDEVTGDRRG